MPPSLSARPDRRQCRFFGLVQVASHHLHAHAHAHARAARRPLGTAWRSPPGLPDRDMAGGFPVDTALYLRYAPRRMVGHYQVRARGRGQVCRVRMAGPEAAYAHAGSGRAGSGSHSRRGRHLRVQPKDASPGRRAAALSSTEAAVRARTGQPRPGRGEPAAEVIQLAPGLVHLPGRLGRCHDLCAIRGPRRGIPAPLSLGMDQRPDQRRHIPLLRSVGGFRHSDTTAGASRTAIPEGRSVPDAMTPDNLTAALSYLPRGCRRASPAGFLAVR
jgi:hypothetical protein